MERLTGRTAPFARATERDSAHRDRERESSRAEQPEADTTETLIWNESLQRDEIKIHERKANEKEENGKHGTIAMFNEIGGECRKKNELMERVDFAMV